MSFLKSSPHRRLKNDLEAGGSRSNGDPADEDEESSSPFDITSTKNASLERLRRWRQAALVLNASRRFRYTLDLKREEEKKQRIATVRAHVQAIRAAYLFKDAGNRENGKLETHPTPSGDFGIGQEQLALMSRNHNVSALETLGGVKRISSLLKTNLEKGIEGDDTDLLKRRNAFGSNTYPRKKGRSFWMFLWEAWQDLTLIILMIAAVASLALGIKTEWGERRSRQASFQRLSPERGVGLLETRRGSSIFFFCEPANVRWMEACQESEVCLSGY